MDTTVIAIRKAQWTRRMVRCGMATMFIAFYIWCAHGTDVSLYELYKGLPELGKVVRQMYPPEIGAAADIAERLVETLEIGVLATFVGGILGFMIGPLAARNFSPHLSVFYVTRALIAVGRGISELIWALLFVIAFGIGPFAGVLAISIFTMTFVGKLLAEAIEAIDVKPIEALTATGAKRWQSFLYGAWPQVRTSFSSYCLYMWDHNTRQASVLGFVGAGGLGFTIFTAISTYEFQRASAAILVMVFLITLIDIISRRLRRRFA